MPPPKIEPRRINGMWAWGLVTAALAVMVAIELLAAPRKMPWFLLACLSLALGELLRDLSDRLKLGWSAAVSLGLGLASAGLFAADYRASGSYLSAGLALFLLLAMLWQLYGRTGRP